MLNKKMKALIAVLSVSLAIGLAALGAGIISSKASSASGSAVASTTPTSGASSSDNSSLTTKAGTTVSTGTAGQTDKAGTTVSTGTAGQTDKAGSDSSDYTKRDLEQSPDLSDAKIITLTDGQDVEITEEGIYVISGTAKDVTIKVTAAEDAKVQLVLDGVSISNTDSPAIYVTEADKVFITTTEGSSNTLSVSGSFVADGDTNLDAVIFSKQDLVLNGLGSLNVSASEGNAITSKDDLKVTGGTYTLTAESKKGLEANDRIMIYDGNFTISAKEGMEATQMIIDGGDITISASDDGLNATLNSENYDVLVVINNGNIKIDMAQGDTDGIDSNGDITINGGRIEINCQSPFDYDGTGTLNGGSITVNGEETTELTNQFGGMGGGKGQMGSNGSDGRMGQAPDGQAPSGDGSMPKMPSDGNAPELPSDGSMPELPSDGSASEMPSGQAPNGQMSGKGMKNSQSGSTGI